MTTTIALAGKGGVGKTTLAALIIKYLVQVQDGPVLAIDADPSSNLNMLLGLDLNWTVGDIREEMLSKVKESLTAGGAAMGTLAGGMTKRAYLDYEVQSALEEGARFDLIAMGRSEGPGCYCAVNHNLREVIDAISKNYRYLVIDNEAGMEHLSRRTTRAVDHLLIVTDPTLRGLVAAERIASFQHDMDIDIRATHLILNRLQGNTVPRPLFDRIEASGLPYLGAIPADESLAAFEFSDDPLVAVENDSSVYRALEAMLDILLFPPRG